MLFFLDCADKHKGQRKLQSGLGLENVRMSNLHLFKQICSHLAEFSPENHLNRVVCLLRAMEEVNVDYDCASWWLWCLESSKGFQVDEWKTHCLQMLEGQCCNFHGANSWFQYCSHRTVFRFTSKSRHELSILPSPTFQEAPDTRLLIGDSCCLVTIYAC